MEHSLLLSKWEKDITNIFPEDQGQFHTDGIIDEKSFRESAIRLLFIAKEPNAANHDKAKEDRDFGTWLLKNEEWVRFKSNIGRWALGILENFPDFDEKHSYENWIKSLQRIAFINLKKTGGGGTINKKVFLNHLRDEVINQNIINQIELISPTHIIFCLGELDDCAETIFKGSKVILEKNKIGMGIDIWNSKKIIHFYHPSGRTAYPLMYYYLKELWGKNLDL